MVDYFHKIVAVLNQVDKKSINRVVGLIQSSDRIYIIGNGGSQATAEHFAVDLLKYGGKRAYALSSSAMLTMSSNDFGYEHSFNWLLSRYLDKNDLIFGISTSGKSLNILRAFFSRLDVKSVFLTGLWGKNEAKNVSEAIIINSKQTQILEDISLIICHNIALKLNELRGKNG